MKYVPSLEKSFKPMILELRKFNAQATEPFAICVERQNGYRYRYDMKVFRGDNVENYEMVERVIKSKNSLRVMRAGNVINDEQYNKL